MAYNVIKEDFMHEVDGTKATIKSFAVACAIVSGTTTVADVVGQYRGLFILATGLCTGALVPHWEYEMDYQTISEWLVQAFEMLSKSLDETLQIAMTANYYSNGVWLVDDDNMANRQQLDGLTQLLRKKIVDMAVNTTLTRLVGDTSIKQDACTGTGQYRIEGYCWYLISAFTGQAYSWCKEEALNCNLPWTVNKDPQYYQKITKHGLQLLPYYKALIDCAKHGGGEPVATTASATDLTLPRCYYNTPASLIEWRLMSNWVTDRARFLNRLEWNRDDDAHV
ncbi:Uu.00g000150.m01.CDS01 [Anthostomella pinea]|uniref:Uu.00g000150.m01.CDS01 n=1 Tax=Anthostomella pinea TaxID=933095 RepID=A0AAI8VJ46_9PEZI|nr:Uu.00g000150.m01.CDS01 [Anthostomella pinea]